MNGQAAFEQHAATPPQAVLRRLLVVDEVLTGLNGLGYAAGASVLDGLLGVSAGTLVAIGVFLMAFAGLVAYASRLRDASSRLVPIVVTANAVWAVASVVVAITDPLTMTSEGRAWTILQAAVVASLAVGQARASR